MWTIATLIVGVCMFLLGAQFSNAIWHKTFKQQVAMELARRDLHEKNVKDAAIDIGKTDQGRPFLRLVK